MTLSDFRRITDELLSAYIDDEVTEQERALVEAAIVADDEIAWRLNSLRQTVTLLRDLPELALPRSFTLTLDQVRVAPADEQFAGVGATEQQPVALPTGIPHLRPNLAPFPQAEAGFWEQVQEGWRRFWQGGNPMLRNAAAVSFALMLLIASGGQFLTRALSQPVGMMATAPEAAPAAGSVSSEGSAVALAPTATESLQIQPEPASSKAAGQESARVLQSQAEPASATDEASAESAAESTDATSAGNSANNADNAASRTTESPVVESEAAENISSTADATADNYAAQEEAQAAVAGAADTSAAPASDSAQEAPAAAAAMAAPAAPPFPDGPRPQSGGGGDGMGAGGAEALPPGMGGGEAGLVPPQAYGFDTNPVGEPALPAEEAVSASVAAAPAEEAPAEAVADIVGTPAVDAPVAAASVAEVASASIASEAAATEATTVAITESAVISGQTTQQTIVEATVEATAETPIEATIIPTPEAVALVAPGEITNTDVVENAPTDSTVAVTGPAGNLPVVWVAQGTFLLLTIMLTSLWWRSRSPRRPRQN